MGINFAEDIKDLFTQKGELPLRPTAFSPGLTAPFKLHDATLRMNLKIGDRMSLGHDIRDDERQPIPLGITPRTPMLQPFLPRGFGLGPTRFCLLGKPLAACRTYLPPAFSACG